MAIKHVKAYYKTIEKQYLGLRARVKEFDEALKMGEVSPKQVKQARSMLFKVEDNYKRWSYLIFLLNQPAKKEKIKEYNNQYKELEKETKPYSAEEIIKENECSLKDFESLLKEVKSHD